MAYSAEIYIPATAQTSDISTRTRAIQVVKTLDSSLTTFRVNSRAITNKHLFDHMRIKKNGVEIISGIIAGQSDRAGSLADEKDTVFQCLDWGYYLAKRIVAKKYENKTASEILTDMFSRYASEFTTTNVDSSTAVIAEAAFQYTPLQDAIEYVLDMSTDWHYYVDKNKDLHFFYLYESDGPQVTASKILLGSLQVDYSGTEHYNRVWLVGIKQPDATAIDVYYTSDGEQRYFGPLPYEPSGLKIYFTPSGLPEYQLSIAKEADDDGSSYDMLYNEKTRVIHFPSYQNPSSWEGKIRANFRPVRQYIDYFENADDMAKYGLMERAIKNTTVTDKIEGRRLGTAEVTRSSQVKRIIRFETDNEELLEANIGQRCSVNISAGAWNVAGNFLIRSAIFSMDLQAEGHYARVELEMEEM